MNRRGDPFRRALSGALAALTVGLGVAMPVMDRGAASGVAVESHHDPSQCPTGHDHRLCTQVGANLSLAPPPTEEHQHPFEMRVSVIGDQASPRSGAELAGPRSRAPPLV